MINFGAGPAALPQEVLAESAAAVLDYNNSGLSILEIPHRGKLFDSILEESKSLVKELAGLDDSYEVLWLQGGGRLQFAMIPMNFLHEGQSAGYIDSGQWSYDAIEHASLYGNTITLSSARKEKYTHLPEWPVVLSPDLAYIHMTTNNTIYGTQWSDIPQTTAPLIADMSSDIFSRSRNYKQFDLFYAVAQKNIGAAGVTMIVIKKELLKKVKSGLPAILDYAQQVQQRSVVNTPPVYAIYVALLMLRWTKAKGIACLEQQNETKAALLYQEIERNSLFYPLVQQDSRSRMNVVFRCYQPELEKELITLCHTAGITGIDGHRSTGGFRVSLYNAITIEQVTRLIQVMQLFEQQKH